MKISAIKFRNFNHKLNKTSTFQAYPINLKADSVELKNISFEAKYNAQQKEFHQTAMQVASSRYDEAQKILMQADDVLDEAETLWKQVDSIYKKAKAKGYFGKRHVANDFKANRKVVFRKDNQDGAEIAKFYENNEHVKSIVWAGDDVTIQEVSDSSKSDFWHFNRQGVLLGYTNNAQVEYRGKIYEQLYVFDEDGFSYYVQNADAQIIDETYLFIKGELKQYRNGTIEPSSDSTNCEVEIKFNDSKNYDYISNLATPNNTSKGSRKTERTLKIKENKVIYDSLLS